MPPFVTIERNGRRGFKEIQREFLYGVMTGRPSTLGRYFLTSTYLMVSHDEKPSTLRQANPSTATDLIPIISKDLIDNRANVINNGTMVVNGTLTIEPEASDTTGASPPTTEAKSDKKLPGIILAVVILAGIAWFMLRKKKLKQEPRPAEVVYHQPLAFVSDSTFAGFHEVHETQSKYEMDASRRTYEYGHRDEPVQELP
ncbi:hypothetical protein ACHAPC_004048 [Botrytis cinerea]